ncbi:transcriptional attenuator, LytR family [Desulfosporosinus acidiphilus SJ4]|uniref:Transcriptional attenuator, LytR family n=1 Tax=Desulfosporosinus acidiphilus (strain DSM 22704 / JCM 16185 / SJ4) TaxID=646529 RepID=I4DA46_DESAJ|nr:LCP family protein [Desulfosporosinus acidiphilus]AFM42670.1 transcriptional attenuator, LytR family [Desulfosporosinus acidiphilus SJ4]
MQKRLVTFLLIIGICGFLAHGFGYKGLSTTGKTLSKGNSLNSSSEGLSNPVNILLIGTDQRFEETKFNTDSIILVSLVPETQRISLLSIPRDTRIYLSGHGYVKINAVAMLENLEALQKVVEDLTGEEVSGYILTNFQGFKKIIDTLGGVTVDVEKNMYYETGDQVDGYINLHKGIQRLDGEKALQYARFRHDALSDISRTARQQIVLKAAAKEMFQLSTLPKLPYLVPELMQSVQTNLPAKDIFALAKTAVTFKSSNVISQTLPGTFLEVNRISYWQVDPMEVKKVVSNLQRGITTDRVIDKEPVDLLRPTIPTPAKPIPKVPGNSLDPNGINSTAFSVFGSEQTRSAEAGSGGLVEEDTIPTEEIEGVTPLREAGS